MLKKLQSSSLSNFITEINVLPFKAWCSPFLGWNLSDKEYVPRKSRISDLSLGIVKVLGFVYSLTVCMSMLVLALTCCLTVLKTLGAVVFGVLIPTFAWRETWSYAKVSVCLLYFCLLIWICFFESPRAAILATAPTKDGATSSATLTCFFGSAEPWVWTPALMVT